MFKDRDLYFPEGFELKMPERPYFKVSAPCTVEFEGGVFIYFDEDKSITIKGQNKMRFESEGDVEIAGKNVNIQAEKNLYIGSGEHIVQQSQRIDLNPEKNKSGYKK
jgi:hypothetical protein